MADENEAMRFVERDTWLGIATHGLCDDAKGRIREEIEARYQESVRQAIEEALGPDEAHRAVMDALGDPRKVGRTFRRTLLTRRETEFLEGFAGFLRGGRFGRAVGGTLAALCIAMSIYSALSRAGGRWSNSVSFFFGLVGLLFLTELAQHELAPYLLSSGRRRRAVLWFALTWWAEVLILVAALVLTRSLGDLGPGLVVVASVVGVVFFLWGLWLVRLWRKLGRCTDYAAVDVGNSHGLRA